MTDPRLLLDSLAIPVEIAAAGDTPVRWIDASSLWPQEPFFAQSLERFCRAKRPVPIDSSLQDLLEAAAQLPHKPPSALIFHASRCGSTALVNALQQLDDALVIAEPPVLSDVFDPSRTQASGVLPQLQAVSSCLARLRRTEQSRYFLKFTSWHTLRLELILQLWPSVPWVFVYRDPAEIVVSQLHNRTVRSGWLSWRQVPGFIRNLTGWDQQWIDAASDEAYCARLVGELFATALRHPAARIVLAHQDVNPAGLADLLRQLGQTPSEREWQAVTDSLSRYSKAPAVKPYIADQQTKQELATTAVRQACDMWAGEAFMALGQVAARRQPAMTP